MKKSLVILLVVWIILGLGIIIWIWKYNTLVSKQESVNTAFSILEWQYQRRFDLIPNIVASVKWEANFEKSTLEAVVNARASATKVNLNLENAQEFSEYQNSQVWISQALSRLLMVSENYPNLKSNQAFSDLRIQLEWTENRIAVERKNYNEVAQNYNTYIRLFPNNIFANLYNFDKKPLFEANDKAQNAPNVEFDF